MVDSTRPWTPARFSVGLAQTYVVDFDRCGGSVSWSIVHVATASSTLAGVLAGIAVVSASTLVARFHRFNAYGLGFLASTIFMLFVSSYIFNALTGVQLDSDFYPGSDKCGQAWDQGMVAFGLLFVGIAGLICGFIWMVVNYIELGMRRDLHHRINKFKRKPGELPLWHYVDLHKYARTLKLCIVVGVVLTSNALMWALGNVYIAAAVPANKRVRRTFRFAHQRCSSLAPPLCRLPSRFGIGSAGRNAAETSRIITGNAEAFRDILKKAVLGL